MPLDNFLAVGTVTMCLTILNFNDRPMVCTTGRNLAWEIDGEGIGRFSDEKVQWIYMKAFFLACNFED